MGRDKDGVQAGWKSWRVGGRNSVIANPNVAQLLGWWFGLERPIPGLTSRLEASSFFPKEAQVSLPKAEGVSQERMSRRP